MDSTTKPPVWPPLPPDLHEAIADALATALVLDYRKRMQDAPTEPAQETTRDEAAAPTANDRTE